MCSSQCLCTCEHFSLSPALPPSFPLSILCSFLSPYHLLPSLSPKLSPFFPPSFLSSFNTFYPFSLPFSLSPYTLSSLFPPSFPLNPFLLSSLPPPSLHSSLSLTHLLFITHRAQPPTDSFIDCTPFEVLNLQQPFSVTVSSNVHLLMVSWVVDHRWWHMFTEVVVCGILE